MGEKIPPDSEYASRPVRPARPAWGTGTSRRALHAGSGLGCLTTIVVVTGWLFAQTAAEWLDRKWIGNAAVALVAIVVVSLLLRLVHVRGLWVGFLAGVLSATAIAGLTYGICAYAFREI
jgi:hypothetical protein